MQEKHPGALSLSYNVRKRNGRGRRGPSTKGLIEIAAKTSFQVLPNTSTEAPVKSNTHFSESRRCPGG